MNIEAVRERLSDRLLDISEVNGVAVEKGHLTVYVVEDLPRVHKKVDAVIENEGPGIGVRYVLLSGQFRPFSVPWFRSLLRFFSSDDRGQYSRNR